MFMSNMPPILARISASPDKNPRDPRVELLGKHNIHFYHQLMREIRRTISEHVLSLYQEKRATLHEDDMDNPVLVQTPKKPKRQVLGNYEIHTAREGFASIRHIHSGEIMHLANPADGRGRPALHRAMPASPSACGKPVRSRS